MTFNPNSYTFDADTLLKDAGLIAASAATTVGGSAVILPVGTSYVEAVTIIDITALEVDTTDELYTFIMQGSLLSTFTLPKTLAAYTIGAAAVQPGGAAVGTVGRYYVRWQNHQNGVTYPFVRLYTNVAGTIAGGGGINYLAWVGKTGSSS